MIGGYIAAGGCVCVATYKIDAPDWYVAWISSGRALLSYIYIGQNSHMPHALYAPGFALTVHVLRRRPSLVVALTSDSPLPALRLIISAERAARR